jgi:hypothetical protein
MKTPLAGELERSFKVGPLLACLIALIVLLELRILL